MDAKTLKKFDLTLGILIYESFKWVHFRQKLASYIN